MGSWRGYTSYGKSSLGVDFSVEGLDELLEKIQKQGKNINEAVADAVMTATPLTVSDMKEGAARHRRGAGSYGTDEVYDAIEAGNLSIDGNYIYVQPGIDIKKHPEAIHAVFQEYGDGHSPCFPDPFIRPAFDENRAKIRASMKITLKKWGVPID